MHSIMTISMNMEYACNTNLKGYFPRVGGIVQMCVGFLNARNAMKMGSKSKPD